MPSRRLFSKPPLGAQLNRAQPLAQYLRGFWLLNEGGGNAQNLATPQNVGTLGGATAPTRTTSQFGAGVDFTTAGGYIDCGKGAFLDNLAVETFEALIYLRSLPAYTQRIISKHSGSYNSLMITSGGAVEWERTRATIDTYYITNAGAVAAGNWYHLVGTLDSVANVGAIYINGIEPSYATADGGSGALDSDAAVNLYLGNTGAFNRTFDGVMIYARVWNVYCTPAMATELYANPCSVLQSPNRRAAANSLTSMSASDSASAIDTSSLAVTGSMSDSATGADASSLAATASASESGALADASNIAVVVSVTDAGESADVSALATASSATDAIAGADISSLSASLASTDSGAGADATSALAASETISDSASLVEASALVIAISASDSGAGSEASNLATGGNPSTDDAGSGAENVVLAASANVFDAGVGSDDASVVAILMPIDAGLSGDTSAITASLVATESVAGVDVASIAASFDTTDAASVADVVALAAFLSGVDASSALEDALVAAALGAHDAASGVDISALFLDQRTSIDFAMNNEPALMMRDEPALAMAADPLLRMR